MEKSAIVEKIKELDVVNLMKAGNPRGLESLYRTIKAWKVRLDEKLLKKKELAEQAVQETFLNLHRSQQKIMAEVDRRHCKNPHPDNPRELILLQYLLTMNRNEVRNIFRDQAEMRRLNGTEASLYIADDGREPADSIADRHGSNPAAAIHVEERLNLLRKAFFASFPRKHWEIFFRVGVYGERYEAVAKEFCVSIATVCRIMKRGFRFFQDQKEEQANGTYPGRQSEKADPRAHEERAVPPLPGSVESLGPPKLGA